MQDTYFCYSQTSPLPAQATPQILTELSKTGWECVTVLPVQVKTSQLANTPVQTGYIAMVKKEIPINGVQIVPEISLHENGIIVRDVPSHGEKDND